MPGEIKIDLHDVYNDSDAIDQALTGALEQARRTRTKCLQILFHSSSKRVFFARMTRQAPASKTAPMMH